jgi:hypothetical protein
MPASPTRTVRVGVSVALAIVLGEIWRVRVNRGGLPLYHQN